MKQILILLSILVITLFLSCNLQNNRDNQKIDTLKVKVNIIKMLPVGWGIMYKATIDKIVEGSSRDFNDTIVFGIIAHKQYDDITIGSSCLITFKNSKEINKKSYLPSITGTVSKLNEIWLIENLIIQSKLDKGTQ